MTLNLAPASLLEGKKRGSYNAQLVRLVGYTFPSLQCVFFCPSWGIICYFYTCKIELIHSVYFWCHALDERVSTELKKNIMQGRIAKKLTQAQLAQLINEKPQVIQEYESGKAIPNQQIIAKLERVLSVKLRAKK